MIYIAIDPGANSGCATWSPGDAKITLFEFKSKTMLPICEKLAARCSDHKVVLIGERPKIYAADARTGARGGKGNPNLLLPLYGELQYVNGFLSCEHDVTFFEYLPETWKGRVPKPIHQARVISKASRMYTAPDGVKGDCFDALGLLLFHLTGKRQIHEVTKADICSTLKNNNTGTEQKKKKPQTRGG